MDAPLAGVRVVEVAHFVAVPAAGTLLADLGADVVKVEPPGGDPYRAEAGFQMLNRGKRSAVLDLAEEPDRPGVATRDLKEGLRQRVCVGPEPDSDTGCRNNDIDHLNHLVRLTAEIPKSAAAAKGCDIHQIIIRRIKGNSLYIRKRKIIEGVPCTTIVPCEP